MLTSRNFATALGDRLVPIALARGKTWIFVRACHAGRLDIVERCLELGVPANTGDDACEAELYSIDPKAVSRRYRYLPAVAAALLGGHVSVVEKLFANGGSISSPPHKEKSIAKNHLYLVKHEPVMQYLLSDKSLTSNAPALGKWFVHRLVKDQAELGCITLAIEKKKLGRVVEASLMVTAIRSRRPDVVRALLSSWPDKMLGRRCKHGVRRSNNPVCPIFWVFSVKDGREGVEILEQLERSVPGLRDELAGESFCSFSESIPLDLRVYHCLDKFTAPIIDVLIEHDPTFVILRPLRSHAAGAPGTIMHHELLDQLELFLAGDSLTTADILRPDFVIIKMLNFEGYRAETESLHRTAGVIEKLAAVQRRGSESSDESSHEQTRRVRACNDLLHRACHVLLTSLSECLARTKQQGRPPGFHDSNGQRTRPDAEEKKAIESARRSNFARIIGALSKGSSIFARDFRNKKSAIRCAKESGVFSNLVQDFDAARHEHAAKTVRHGWERQFFAENDPYRRKRRWESWNLPRV
ncbi:hypothetical protein CSOJ01_14196 [Colletotrichum sojae]|uniref:Ankyrin repeat protein n=1 Tax=Colletotrichum sojae TaxID=2175907 RepID=A0A8H6MK72_9PEZI|nr:hypothetical protein CSOJ01_14196 [Colletotrichum sojae]